MSDVTDDDIRLAEERLFSDDEIEKAKPKLYTLKEEKKSFFGRKKEERKEERRDQKKEGRERKDEHPFTRSGLTEPKKEVTLSFYPRRVMRGVLIFLFLFFAVSFFYNPFYSLFPWNLAGAEGNVVGVAVGKGIALANPETPQPLAAAAPEPVLTTPEPEEPLPDNTVEKDPEEQEAPTEPAPANDITASSATGEHTLTIEDIKTETRDWGGKITDVSFIVENLGKAFTPKIKAYAFDEKTDTTYKASPLIKKYALLEINKRLKATIDLSKFQFSDTSTPKTVILQLYDEGDEVGFAKDEKMAQVEQQVTIV